MKELKIVGSVTRWCSLPISVCYMEDDQDNVWAEPSLIARGSMCLHRSLVLGKDTRKTEKNHVKIQNPKAKIQKPKAKRWKDMLRGLNAVRFCEVLLGVEKNRL